MSSGRSSNAFYDLGLFLVLLAMDVTATGTVEKEILEAAENNQLASLKSLLDFNCLSINCTDEDGYTPLHRACYNNHTDVVQFLIKSGAKIDSCTNDGWHPIHCAARWNNVECASILLKFKADINSKTNGGQTPLHIAASQQNSREVLILLLTNMNVDSTTINSVGETAYYVARRSGKLANLFQIVKPSLNNI